MQLLQFTGFFAILFIGICIIVLLVRSSKKEEAISTTVIMIGLELVASSFGGFNDKVVYIISLLKENVPDTDILKIAQASDSTTNFIQLTSGFLIIWLGFALINKQYHKKYILNLRSLFDHSIEQYMKDLGLNRFDFKEKIIDFRRIINKGITMERVADIIEEIEAQVSEFCNESKESKKAYTGMASIPFTIISGTFLGRVKFDDFYEYHKFDKRYYKLKDDVTLLGITVWKQRYPELKLLTKIDDIDKQVNEVVVAIGITSEIKQHQLSQFNCPSIHMAIDAPCDNAITSKQQLYNYSKTISDMLTKISTEFANLKRIHLLYAGQSCLAFDLGTIIEDGRRIKEVVSYQYVTNSTPCYPWGIVINGEHKGTLIRC